MRKVPEAVAKRARKFVDDGSGQTIRNRPNVSHQLRPVAEAPAEYSVAQAAAELEISVPRPRTLIRNGALRSELHGHVRTISAIDLAAFRDSRTRRAEELRAQAPTDWDWEGNVVRVLADYLVGQGWTVEQQADTATRAAGVDLKLTRPASTMWVEVKGWPTSTYTKGPKEGAVKRWRATMARSYAGDLLLSALILRADHPDDMVCLAVPAHETFATLIARLREPLKRLGLGAFVVYEDGLVEEVISAKRQGRGRGS